MIASSETPTVAKLSPSAPGLTRPLDRVVSSRQSSMERRSPTGPSVAGNASVPAPTHHSKTS